MHAHGRWFSPGTPASSTTKTGRHDITAILLKVKHKKSNLNHIIMYDSNSVIQIMAYRNSVISTMTYGDISVIQIMTYDRNSEIQIMTYGGNSLMHKMTSASNSQI